MKISLQASPFFLFSCALFPTLNVSRRYQTIFFFTESKDNSTWTTEKEYVSDGNEKYIFPDGKGRVTWVSLHLWHTIKKSVEIVHIAPGPVSSFPNFTLIPRSALHFSFHKSHSQPEHWRVLYPAVSSWFIHQRLLFSLI